MVAHSVASPGASARADALTVFPGNAASGTFDFHNDPSVKLEGMMGVLRHHASWRRSRFRYRLALAPFLLTIFKPLKFIPRWS